MTKENVKPLFAIYPNADGFGFVCMENARKLIAYESVRINPISNRKIMEKIKQSVDFFKPSIVILQDPDGKHARTGRRVARLIQRISSYAEGMGLPVVKYSRDQIRDVFEQFGVVTKYEISQLLLTEFKELEMKAPKVRSLWVSVSNRPTTYCGSALHTTADKYPEVSSYWAANHQFC